MTGAGGIEVGITGLQTPDQAFGIGTVAEADVIGQSLIDSSWQLQLPQRRQLLLDQRMGDFMRSIITERAR